MTTEPVRVEITAIIGTKIRIYTAWEPTTLMGNHSSVQRFDDRWFGRVGTNRNLPVEVEALKAGSDERIAAVRAWYNSHYERAYEAIIAEHPEVAEGRRSVGEITIWLRPTV